MADGGFYPVPLAADPGDALDFRVRVAGQTSLLSFRRVVPLRASPIVVRTYPPPRKRDVALNAAVIIVFTEPIDKSSLTGSTVQLFRGATAVAGAVTLLQGSGSAVAFVPAAPLARNTDYQLEVRQGVRDLDGDALTTGAAVAFTTGTSSTGPPASIDQAVDTIRITGTTYQLTATVRDAADNILIDQPVTWAALDPGISVSQTGLVTVLAAAPYPYVVSASLGDLIAWTYVQVVAGPPASVEVAPTSATVSAADTVMLHATVRDAAGHLLVYFPDLSWTSSDPAFATVALTDPGTFGSTVATVTGVSPGSVTITGTTGTASGTAAVTVGPRALVASVTVTPGSATLVAEGTVRLSATPRDANGRVLLSRPITWASDNEAVATVDANGLVTAVGLGSATVTATSEGVSGTSAITVTTISLGSVTAGYNHACGLTTTGAAYCWGSNGRGQLGNGSTGSSPAPVAVSAGGLTFTAVSAGGAHTCGVTPSRAVYCWGFNDNGQLGNGSTTSSPVPVAVSAGGLTFTAVSAGGAHTCGVTPSGAPYCWGGGWAGQRGDGSNNLSPVPVAVTAGGLTFTALSAALTHTCGVTPSGAAYCWGENYYGELGNGSTTSSLVPVAVSAGGRTFAAVSAGYLHTCGFMSGGVAYCWGDGESGQLGNGSTTSSSVPMAVIAGGLTFTAVSAGYLHTCGVTPSGVAYCWGDNYYGELGTGSTTSSSVPVAVTGGGLTFTAIGAGNGHTCGLSTSGAGYCWGENNSGQLGDGSTTNSSVPVKVAGQP